MEKYRCFVRNWWVENPDWPNGLEPANLALEPKEYIDGEFSLSEAQAHCQAYNRVNNPGRLSRKMEFESV